MEQTPLSSEFREINHASCTAENRRIAIGLAEMESLPAARVGDAAIVATELTTNLLKHAQHGVLQIAPMSDRGKAGIEFLAVDRGPGIANMSDCFFDGYSTTGTAGTGLGAIRRLSNDFDIYSEPGKGTVLLSRIFSDVTDSRLPFDLGVTERPVGGETVSGDSWAVRLGGDSVVIMLADGLGHGVLAYEASTAAARAFRASREETPVELVQVIHRALRGTRGAAVAVARVEFGERQVRFAGLGNISGVVIAADKAQSMVSHNGTAGFEARQIREFVYPWTDASLIVMHSDGLSGHWNLANCPALTRHCPSVISGFLYREAARDRDDASVIVGKRR